MPEVVELANEDESLQYFTMLEAFSDGWGGWRIVDVFGKPVLELPDWLVHDLLTLRYIASIMREQHKRKQNEAVDKTIPTRKWSEQWPM